MRLFNVIAAMGAAAVFSAASPLCAAETLTEKNVVLQNENFTAKVKDKPRDLENPSGCECSGNVSYPSFSGGGEGVRAVNETLRQFATERTVHTFTWDNCQGMKLTPKTYAATSTVISVGFEEESFCGAYPNDVNYGLAFDAQSGRRLALQDVVAKRNWAKASRECARQYHLVQNDGKDASATAAEDGPEPDILAAFKDRAINESIVIDVREHKAVLLLDPKFWAHALGGFDCTLPPSLLTPTAARLLK